MQRYIFFNNQTNNKYTLKNNFFCTFFETDLRQNCLSLWQQKRIMFFLSAHNVSKHFDGHTALDDVSLNVPENTIYGLLGPNGAGKTTLIRIINRIVLPDSGTITLNGQPMTDADTARIGYMPEERGLYRKMKVGEQALYLAQLKGMTKTDALKQLKYWFEKFQIASWWNKRVEELSKGMAQKVQFITTVAHRPQLLIFDEPFSGFDPINADTMRQEILELKANGATIILSTHNMESVETLCDEITLINQAKAVLQGNVAEIRESYKQHLYKVVVNGVYSPAPTMPFSPITQETAGNRTTLTFRLDRATSPNTLLNAICANHNLLLFEEVLPSMNDIFIRTVSEH